MWLCRKAEGSSRQLHSLFFPRCLSVSRCSSLYRLSKAEQGQRFQCLQTGSRHLWCAVAAQTQRARRAVPRRVAELRRLKKKGETWNSYLHLPQWDIVRPGLHQTMASIGHNTHWEGWLCTLALQASQLPLHFFQLCPHMDRCVQLLALPALPIASQLLCTSGESRWLCSMNCCAREHSLSLFHVLLY